MGGILLVLLTVSLTIALGAEFASWYTTLRKRDFREKVAAVRDAETKLQNEKAKVEEQASKAATKSNKKDKKIAAADGDAPRTSPRIKLFQFQVTERTKEVQMLLIWGQVYSAVAMLGLLPIIGWLWHDVSVGTLPFQPVSFFKGMFQQGLDEPGLFDCSAIALWLLMVNMWRQILRQVLPHPQISQGLFGGV